MNGGDRMQNRLKSPVLWTSIFALFYFVMKNWIGFEIPMWQEFVDFVMAIVVALGVVNNPTNKDNI